MSDFVEFRAVIKFLTLKGHSFEKVKVEFESVYGTGKVSDSFIKKYIREYKHGRTTVFDEPRSGRPLEIDHSGIAARCRKVIDSDPKMSIEELASLFNVSIGIMHSIMHQELGMKKLTVKWVPHFLNETQKQERIQAAAECLELYNKHKSKFIDHLLTMDETWIYGFDPLTAEESREWTTDKSQVSKRVRPSRHGLKVMACVWWDHQGIVYIKYMESGQTVNAEEYRSQIITVAQLLREKRPWRGQTKPVFLQDNARPHKARDTMSLLSDLEWKIINYPPYSPDLAQVTSFYSRI